MILRVVAALAALGWVSGCSASINREQCATRFAGAANGMTPGQTAKMREDCFSCVDGGRSFSNQTYACSGAPNARLAGNTPSPPAPTTAPPQAGPTDVFGAPIRAEPQPAARGATPPPRGPAAPSPSPVVTPYEPVTTTPVNVERKSGLLATATEPASCPPLVKRMATSARDAELRKCESCTTNKSTYRLFESASGGDPFATCSR